MAQTRAPSTYLSDPDGNIIGMVGLDGREYLFPETLTSAINVPATSGEVHAIYEDGVPVGLVGPTGDLFFPEALTSGPPTGARRLAIGVRELISSSSVIGLVAGRGFGFPSPLVSSEPGAPTPAAPVVVNAGTISGARGNGNTITGGAPTVTGTPTPTLAYQWQADDGGWGDIVGATSADLVDTALTAPLPVRRRVTATNTEGTDFALSNTLAAEGSGLGFSKLVYPTDRYWYDTVPNGGVLSPVADYQTGAGYIVTLEAIGPQAQPAAGSVTVSGGNYVAGPGFAALNPDTYLLRTLNVLAGKMSETYVMVVSNKATSYVANSISDLNDHLTTIGNQITTDLAAFEAAGGAAIDLNPAVNFGDYNINQIPNGAQTKKVTLRTANADRIFGPQPTFKRISVNNGKHICLQGLRYRWDTTPASSGPSLVGVFGTSPFCSVLRPDIMGGKPTFNADGSVTHDPNTSLDATNPWNELFTTLHGLNSGSYTRLDLHIGQTATTETGGAVGVWNVPSQPAYIGNNLAGGTPGIVALVAQASGGSGFLGQIEVVELVGSTPVVTTHGGTVSKPNAINGFPAPDGKYIVAWRLENGGTGYAGLIARASVRWNGQRRFSEVYPAAISATNNEALYLNVAEPIYSSVYMGIRQTIYPPPDARWLIGQYGDNLYADAGTAAWREGTRDAATGSRFLFNFWGRSCVQTDHFGNEHFDNLQMQASVGASGGIRTFSHVVGNVSWHYGGLGGGQGAFISDVAAADRGHQVNSFGNFWAPGYANAFFISTTIYEWSAYDQTLSGFGSANASVFADATAPQITVRLKALAGSQRTGSWAPTAEQRLVDLLEPALNTTNFDDPLLTWTDSVAEIRRRFTPKAGGPVVGYGPFADPVQMIDHVNRVFDPSYTPFRTLLPLSAQVAPSSEITSEARQLQTRASGSTITAISGGTFCIASTRTGARTGTFTSSVPATIEPGQWIAFRHTSAADGDTLGTPVTYTIDGVSQSWNSRTAAAGPFPAGNNHANIVTTPVTTGDVSITVWEPITSYAVPPGGLLLFPMAVGANAPSGPTLDAGASTAGWQLLVVQQGSTNCSTSVWWWRNDTGSTQNVTLNFSNIGNRRGRGCITLIPRTDAGGTLVPVSAPGASTATSNYNAPSLNAGASRRHLWFAIAGVNGQNNPSISGAAPTNYTNPQDLMAPVPATASAALFMAQRFLEAQTEDPPAWTGTASGNMAAVTVAVYEVPA